MEEILIISNEIAILSQTLSKTLFMECISEYEKLLPSNDLMDNIDADQDYKDNYSNQNSVDKDSLSKRLLKAKYNIFPIEELGANSDDDNDNKKTERMHYDFQNKVCLHEIEENICLDDNNHIINDYQIASIQPDYYGLKEIKTDYNVTASRSRDMPIIILQYQKLDNNNINSPLESCNSSSSFFNDPGSRQTSSQTISINPNNINSLGIISRLTTEEIIMINSFNKEGWLYKKSNNIFLGWQKRYFKIKYPRIYYAKTIEDVVFKRNIRCINVQLQPCMLKDELDLSFSINIINTNKKLRIKAFNDNDAREWENYLRKMFEFANKKESISNYTASKEKKPWKMDQIGEEEFLKIGNTGDILLFQTQSFRAKFQRSLTLSDYDHVAMLVRIDGTLYIFDVMGNRGVCLTSWEEFINTGAYKSYTRIVFRKLEISTAIEDMLCQLYDFVAHTMGGNYCFNVGKLFKKNSIIPSNFKQKNPIKKEGYFCSELIASAYKAIGLLSKEKSSCQFWPINFSSKRFLLLSKGAKLGNEMTILLKERN